MTEKMNVLEATTEIVVAAVSAYGKQFPDAEYAKHLAEFAQVIYKKLESLHFNQ